MSEERHQQIAQAFKFNIAMAAMLAILKVTIGFLTHSMAILASGLDSTLDVATSTVNLLAARASAKPPDAEHEYGHGKVESLASLFQSVFIGLSGIFLVVESVKRLMVGSYVSRLPVAIGVMVFSLAISLLIVWRMKRVSKKNSSLIMDAERLHFMTDIGSNGGVLVALCLVSVTGFVAWDLIVSIAIAIYIFKTSLKIFKTAVDELLDRSLPTDSKREIKKEILAFNPSIVGIHDFRGHRVGTRLFLDFHIEIHGIKEFRQAHDIAEALTVYLKKLYGDADVTIHFDPEGEV